MSETAHYTSLHQGPTQPGIGSRRSYGAKRSSIRLAGKIKDLLRAPKQFFRRVSSSAGQHRTQAVEMWSRIGELIEE